MKIKSIEYYNFRNFAEQGKIEFATDGTITIIYGTNGDGKTTLHQLFQWILYGNVSFNKTTSADKLYNLEKGHNLLAECSFLVWGQIEFEHGGENYIVRREWEYYKNKKGDISRKTAGDEFFVQKTSGKNAGKNLDRPNAVIEEVLPSGLAPYFFFDGETMIADLKLRGSDSAKVLKKALHSIFELEIYEKALSDIGSKSKTQSVIGQLDSRRKEAQAKSTTEKQHKAYLKDIRILTTKLETIENETKEYSERIEEYTKRIQAISEEIGSNVSKKQLENSRNVLKRNIEEYKDSIRRNMLRFGTEIADNYSYLLISGVVDDASERIYLQVQDEEKKIIPGLTKELLNSLLKNSDQKSCICGHELGKNELAILEEWKSFFPPASYKSTYDKFTRSARRFSGKYDDSSLFNIFKSTLEIRNSIKRNEEQISEIDKELANTGNIDALLDERRQLEKDINSLKQKISKNDNEKGEAEHQKVIRERAIKNVGAANKEVQKYTRLIDIMERVGAEIRETLRKETYDYSVMLKNEIQSLIDSMLTSRREVLLNEDFQLQVKDSYGDESKSEGQFAVISFAYIGGILKVLKSHERLKGKEYPLILDGPFSKLDETQKRNVVTTIPQYAPQVIIFSKDFLGDFITEDIVGQTWTIVSNAEKNYAHIEKGYLWK